jgi:hypothetical protein
MVFVSFGDHQVAVHAHAAEAWPPLYDTFRELLQPEGAPIIGRLDIFGSGSRYRLLANGQLRLDEYDLADVVRQVKFEVTEQLIRARPDLLWLHAGAAARDGEAVLFPAPAGRGKSTMVTGLCANGWSYLSDDVVAVDLTTSTILPFPLAPTVRNGDDKEVPDDRVEELNKIAVELPAEICREPVEVRAVIFPAYRHRTPSALVACQPGKAALELLRNCLNFQTHGASAVQYVCALVQRIPAFDLSYSSAAHASDLMTRSAATDA